MLRKIFNTIRFITCNLTVAFAVLVFSMVMLDKYNPGVGFMSLSTAKIYIILFAVIAFVFGLITVIDFLVFGKSVKNSREKSDEE